LPTKRINTLKALHAKRTNNLRLLRGIRRFIRRCWGSRRYLATVFWSLSTAASDTQRERAFVKTAYPSQAYTSTKRFASNVTHPTKKFCLQRPPTKYFKKEPTIMEKWQRSLYQPNLPLGADGTKVTASKAHITLSKEAAKEGMVLLKNNESLLPFQAGTKLALFGKGSFDYVKGGGGSGDVTVAYTTNLYEGFKKLPEKLKCMRQLSDYYRKEVEKQYEAGAEPGMTVEPAFRRN